MPTTRIIETATVQFNPIVAHDTGLLSLNAPQIASQIRPGQFINLSIPNSLNANLLRRPFSVHQSTENGLQLLYKIKGDVTRAMAMLQPGQDVELMGPLGNAFCIPEKKTVLLVGGGLGIAPLTFLDAELRKQNETYILYGVRSMKEAIKIEGSHVNLHVDDIFNTFVTDTIEQKLITWRIDEVKTCGPLPMMKEVVKIAGKHNIPVEVSMEAHMACGFGVCLGCVIPTKGGYQKVCSDGPIFKGDQLW